MNQNRKILLAPQSYEARSKAATGQRLVNMYAELNPEGSKFPFTLYGAPGLKEFVDLGTNKGINGMRVLGGVLYAFSDGKAYTVTEGAVVTGPLTGEITGTLGRLDLSDNGQEITAITIDHEGFVIDGTGITKITDGDFPLSSAVTFLDGYTIVSKYNSGQFNISSLYDSSSYDALEFATAEEKPDNLVRPYAFDGSLWLFGESSYEVYYNNGNQDFPFAPVDGASSTSRGLAAKHSVAEDDNTLVFLGNDRIIYKLEGYTAKRISNHALERILQSYAIISDAFGFIFTMDGHKFYVLTFPQEQKTWVIDLETLFVHERSSREGNTFTRWRPNCFVNFAGKNLVGDYINGKIYEIDPATFVEGEEYIQRLIQGTALWKDGHRFVNDYLRLDIDAGEGLAVGQGEDPQVMMRFSDDGAKSWSNELWRSFGKIGETNKQVVYRQLGQTQSGQRIYEWVINDPVKVAIHGAYWDGRLCRA